MIDPLSQMKREYNAILADADSADLYNLNLNRVFIFKTSGGNKSIVNSIHVFASLVSCYSWFIRLI